MRIMEKKMETTIMENQMEKKMENEMETVIIQGIIGIRVFKIRVIVGAPLLRIIVFWSLYWGPLFLGNYHLVRDKWRCVRDCLIGLLVL